MQFGLIVIGDEILSGRRRDRHFDFFRELLAQRGFSLRWLQILPDDPDLLVQRLKDSMQEGIPVFSCGGIGATPDDFTRECAARAADVPSVRHAGAAELIEARFAADAYPHRIRMADLPQGAALIPNPYNQVPGFSINEHYFMPGFPDMAHPMAKWVLQTYYPEDSPPETEMSLRIYGVSENELMNLMQAMTREYPEFKLFSLPRIGDENFVELGLHGGDGLNAAFEDMKSRLEKLDFRLSL